MNAMNAAKFSLKLNDIFGCLTSQKTASARRRFLEDEDLLVPGIDPFLIDGEVKIVQSKAYRRLFDKTQVMTHHSNAHVRRRASHVAEVAAVATQIANVLGLNTHLTRAIALGHDTGHTPLGHAGEEFIRTVSGREFRHEVFAVVIAQHIERMGKGLNLTHETLSGIAGHSRGTGALVVGNNMSPEAAVAMFSDKIAYMTADYNDFKRIGILLDLELDRLMNSLGATQRERINRLITALCLESAEKGRVSFGDSETAQHFLRVKDLMFAVYPTLNLHKPEEMLARIYEFISRVFGKHLDPILLLSLMTDQDVLGLSNQNVLDVSRLAQTTVWELLPVLRDRKVEWWKLDLDW